MKSKNKYIYRSKLSEAKFREIVKCFSLDIEANKAAVLASLNRNTLNRYYTLIRRRIAEYCERQGYCLSVSSFDGLRVSEEGCEKNDITVKNSPTLFGVCLVNGWIYTEIIQDEEMPEGKSVLSSKQDLECYINACGNPRWKDYRAVVDYRYGRYARVGNALMDRETGSDVKTCDLFWGYVKTRLMKFNGVSKNTLYFHIKECEFRFNHRTENLYKLLLKIIRENPIN